MNQIAIARDSLAEKRREAARKAVETRRRNLAAGGAVAMPPARRARQPLLHASHVAQALDAFEREAHSESPDWHRAALALRHALRPRPVLVEDLPTKPVALPPPAWPDYAVNQLGAFKVRNPTIVVTFADGEVIRAPAVSARDKPVNIGRGVRVACAFYQARMAWRKGIVYMWPRVPAITACICEETGETYDPELCTIKTVEARKAKPK